MAWRPEGRRGVVGEKREKERVSAGDRTATRHGCVESDLALVAHTATAAFPLCPLPPTASAMAAVVSPAAAAVTSPSESTSASDLHVADVLRDHEASRSGSSKRASVSSSPAAAAAADSKSAAAAAADARADSKEGPALVCALRYRLGEARNVWILMCGSVRWVVDGKCRGERLALHRPRHHQGGASAALLHSISC